MSLNIADLLQFLTVLRPTIVSAGRHVQASLAWVGVEALPHHPSIDGRWGSRLAGRWPVPARTPYFVRNLFHDRDGKLFVVSYGRTW